MLKLTKTHMIVYSKSAHMKNCNACIACPMSVLHTCDAVHPQVDLVKTRKVPEKVLGQLPCESKICMQ